ncbi:hypothetical protein Tco_0858801 [Tanacetum coccineum]|uniref:Uncharacterized protein n=1 Tax=Tanacetum coccineum TaxID=301880 RepID=A0ABQ5BE70_9ASTR
MEELKKWDEEKEVRVPTTKIFCSKILINNLVYSLIIDGCSINNLLLGKLVDFLKLPIEICPIEGYKVYRVPVTIGKLWRCEVNGKYDVKRNLYVFSWEGRRIAMVPPKVTPQLPKPEVKVEKKIVKAEVVEDHIEKIQDLQSYKQHDDNISTLSFGTTNKVGTLKTCEEIMVFNDEEDVKVDVKRKSIEDKVRREKMFDVDEALNIKNSRASSFQVRGIHVEETKVNAVRDWPSPKILLEATFKSIKYISLSLKIWMDGSRPEEQHLVVSYSDEEIVKFLTQPAIIEISGEDGSNLKDFLNVLTVKEAYITRPIMAVEDEPLMMRRLGPNIIKEDFSH